MALYAIITLAFFGLIYAAYLFGKLSAEPGMTREEADEMANTVARMVNDARYGCHNAE